LQDRFEAAIDFEVEIAKVELKLHGPDFLRLDRSAEIGRVSAGAFVVFPYLAGKTTDFFVAHRAASGLWANRAAVPASVVTYV
jgi:hypothetical protein